jgi:hypothetical protein
VSCKLNLSSHCQELQGKKKEKGKKIPERLSVDGKEAMLCEGRAQSGCMVGQRRRYTDRVHQDPWRREMERSTKKSWYGVYINLVSWEETLIH